MAETTHIRVSLEDASRIEALRRRLTVQAGGVPQTTADTIHAMLVLWDWYDTQRQPAQEPGQEQEGER